MKRRLTVFIVILIAITGLSLLLYPTVSDYINSLTHRRTIEDYKNKVEQLDTEEYESILMAAREFNRKLDEGVYPYLHLTEEQLLDYENLLDITGTGVMGYIEIPSVDILLPIYHGTGDAVLQKGVGHLAGSSFPVTGDYDTHSILSGHRGLPSAKLFTNIDKLVIGDIFTVQVLQEAYTYEVDQILTVLPHQVNSLTIEKGQDYCTLVTCTPYGVNTHRLLIRGHLIETPEEESSHGQGQTGNQNGQGSGATGDFDMDKALPITIAVMVVLLLIIIIIAKVRKRRQ